MAITQGYEEGRRGSVSLYGALAVAYVFILIVQLYRSITIDTYGLIGTRFDLLGYGICLGLGVLLILRAGSNRRLMLDVLLLSVLLVTYIAVIVTYTAQATSLLAFLVSRYGILTWLLLGAGTAAAASYIPLPAGTIQARRQRALFIVAALIIAGLLAFFSINYLASPVFTLSYQSIADNLIITLLILMVFTQILWAGRVPLPVAIGLIVIGTLAVTAVARMQSTSVVGFWVAGLVVYFWSVLTKLPMKYRVLALVTVAIGTALFLSSDIFTQTFEKTRFAELRERGHLSSLDGRLALLADFGRQFAVSPIFGNFSAEIRAGSGIGNYPHTLLSFLTHTGVIGTGFLGVILFLICSRRFPLRRLTQPDFQQLLFLGLVIGLGTTYTFMTWSVFWFMLGFMCKTPIFRTRELSR